MPSRAESMCGSRTEVAAAPVHEHGRLPAGEAPQPK